MFDESARQRGTLIETERLFTFPLNRREMRLYMAGDNQLESFLGVSSGNRQITPELTDALTHSIMPKVETGEDPVEFVTLWTIISKELQVMVGDWCFKGAPGFRQDVEIGYGTYPEYRGNGFMSETMRAASDWALTRPGIMQVLAETMDSNLPSHRILQKAGFKIYREERDMFFWRKLATLI